MKNFDADRTETASCSAGRESFSVPLTESDLRTIEEFSTAKKAEWIVRKYIKGPVRR